MGQEQLTDKEEDTHRALFLVLVQSPASGRVSLSQTRATHEWFQHISSSSQTKDTSQCERTYETSGGKCLLQDGEGRCGIPKHPPQLSASCPAFADSTCLQGTGRDVRDEQEATTKSKPYKASVLLTFTCVLKHWVLTDLNRPHWFTLVTLCTIGSRDVFLVWMKMANTSELVFFTYNLQRLYVQFI